MIGTSIDRLPGRTRGVRIVALASLLALASCAQIGAQEPMELVLPPRAGNAPSGSALLPSLVGLPLADREVVLAHEFAAGNVPAFLRRLVPVTTQATIAGRTHAATFWCTPDYLGFGTDADWFRMPITPTFAQHCADALDCVLPTRRMVDAIWAQAAVKLAPFPYSPSVHDILAVELFHRHHLQIESQRGTASRSLLVAGIKKDLVASALIGSWPGRVVIYGWHYQNGTPIQPLSKVHTFGHVDYSHGARLVARRVVVDGVTTTIDAVLADPSLHVLLSDEGPFASWRYPAQAAESFPLRERFPASGRELASWRAKFTQPVLVGSQPAAPSGDPLVLRIMDPAGGTESLRIDRGLVRDVGVQADLLCEYRPELAGNGFERLGIFVRDRANGAFDGTLSQAGACYALTFDSHDGRVRCLRCAGGVLTDLLPSPRSFPSTAWRRFRIEARGDRLAFFLDGERLLDATDATHAQGAFGIGYHEYFATNAHQRGTRADAFFADVPGAFSFVMRPGLGNGGLELRRSRGIPGDLYFTAITVAPGAFPNGWFFGLDPSHDALAAFLASGHPAFLGVLDADGSHGFSTWGLPLGIPLQGVSVELDPSARLLLPSRVAAMTTR